MKLASWNVNGLRAAQKKGFNEWLANSGYDVVCLQETKLQEDQVELPDTGYTGYFHCAQRKGYSGTAVLTKEKPLEVTYGIGSGLDAEGRTVTCEFPSFFLVCCYTPNSQDELARIDVRQKWDEEFRTYCKNLDEKKSVLICGDLNVAHKPIDLKNPKTNEGHAGYSKPERDDFDQLLAAGFTDTFRHFYPDATGIYSWWSYRFHAREKNAGWRIDYWLCSNRFISHVVDSKIATEVMGSDHCPVVLTINL